MALGSFVHDALVDLGPNDLARMLDLDETLFVEHKKSAADESTYGLVKAVSAFANTLGGWVLLGVHEGKLLEEPAGWALPDAPPLIDFVRDRLRDEVDPLPPFEAKVMEHDGGHIGVVRVYESSDTPHVAIRSGAVFVREVAGVRDAANPGSPGSGQRGERVYEATQIRNRAQLIELAARGRAAAERAEGLVDPGHPLPLVSSHLPFELERVAGGVFQPTPSQRPAIVVRMVPFTLAPRFQGWATTANCSSALLSGVEELSRRAGLSSSWVEPDPSGAGVAVPLDEGALHTDGAGLLLAATAHLVLDAAGVAGAALSLSPPDDERRRSWLRLDQLVDLVRLPILTAANLLCVGEFLGRTRCQIDLLGLSRVFLLENAGDNAGRHWMPTSGELSLPADAEQIDDLAQRAANAFWRSAGVAAWDSQTH
jgi:Putative DNA-binding domain